MTIPIDKNIPIARAGRPRTHEDYPFAAMQVGDSFLAPIPKITVKRIKNVDTTDPLNAQWRSEWDARHAATKAIDAAIASARKYLKIKLSRRKVAEGVRVWRVA